MNSHHALDILLHGSGIIELFVSGRVDQCQSACSSALDKLANFFRVLVQFLEIALLERLPFFGFMCKPLTQRGTRRQVFQPGVDLQRFPGDTTRPYPVDKHAGTITGRWWFIGPFYLNLHQRDAGLPGLCDRPAAKTPCRVSEQRIQTAAPNLSVRDTIVQEHTGKRIHDVLLKRNLCS